MTDPLKDVVNAAITGNGLSPEEKRVAGKMLFTYGWRASAFAFAVWACGGFAAAGFGKGFAYAEETTATQTSVERRLTAIERRQLEQDIMATLKESCAAPTKDYFRTRLNELQEQYAAMNKSRLDVPSCERLGITP